MLTLSGQNEKKNVRAISDLTRMIDESAYFSRTYQKLKLIFKSKLDDKLPKKLRQAYYQQGAFDLMDAITKNGIVLKFNHSFSSQNELY